VLALNASRKILSPNAFLPPTLCHRILYGSRIHEGGISGMRLTREKWFACRIIHRYPVASDDVEFVEDRDTHPPAGRANLTATLKEEEKPTPSPQRITSQKKEILEGSEEWDVLYRNITPTNSAAWA